MEIRGDIDGDIDRYKYIILFKCYGSITFVCILKISIALKFFCSHSVIAKNCLENTFIFFFKSKNLINIFEMDSIFSLVPEAFAHNICNFRLFFVPFTVFI